SEIYVRRNTVASLYGSYDTIHIYDSCSCNVNNDVKKLCVHVGNNAKTNVKALGKVDYCVIDDNDRVITTMYSLSPGALKIVDGENKTSKTNISPKRNEPLIGGEPPAEDNEPETNAFQGIKAFFKNLFEKTAVFFRSAGDFLQRTFSKIIAFFNPKKTVEPPQIGFENIKVGVSLPSGSSEWTTAASQFENDFNNKQINYSLVYASKDIATQVLQIEEMINSGCNLLIIAPIDGDALGTVLDLAKERNIPVISFKDLIMSSDAVSYYVCFDHYLAGERHGEYIRDRLKLDTTEGPYNIELFAGDPGDESARWFFSGAMDILNPYIDQGILNVKSGQTDFKEVSTPGNAPEAAQSRMDAIISACYSDSTNLDAVLCYSDPLARGVINTLEFLYSGSWPIITGMGCEIENVKYIINGKQNISVLLDYRILASKAVEMAEAVIHEEEPSINDRESYNNNVRDVPSFACECPVVEDNNYKWILVDSGYYSEEQLGL
ncbi:MAG: sugar-binding protein, partial [Clostridia bacterium]|nr:sugar-binding protein [Clostridia bacterium]